MQTVTSAENSPTSASRTGLAASGTTRSLMPGCGLSTGADERILDNFVGVGAVFEHGECEREHSLHGGS